MKKEKTISISVCDVCGEEANGYWYMTINSMDSLYNGEVTGEYSCPLDLCKTHMRTFDRLIHSQINYAFERYDGANSALRHRTLEKLLELDKEVAE